MIDEINDEIVEFKESFAEEPTVFLHPSTHAELQHEHDVLPFDVIPDRYVDGRDIVVLPEDVDDFRGEMLYQSSPTLHHLEQVIDDIEQHPYEAPDQSAIVSNVIMELRSVTMYFWYDKITDLDLDVPELEELTEEAVVNPALMDLDPGIDVDVYDDDGQPTWEVTMTWDEMEKVTQIPVHMLGLGDIHVEHARNKICEQVLETVDSEIESDIVGTDSAGDEYECGTKVTELGRVFMKSPAVVNTADIRVQ